ncbi:nucleolar transcription factor 1-like isoform X1 [Anopheles stephensi]|uniref:nucleolar transcription factor 1-like isoform X1 n=1 Tax=Anopheles stephensi TaxID=30069 RepID=UPI0016587556|nr:nucleolar transcription factor 1-like isoform X1 [Anopheles stephensi]
MRKRSLSVAYERAPRVEQISKRFEGVPSDHENDSDSEEENEEVEATDTASNWTADDYRKLVTQLRAVLPRKDQRKSKVMLNKIEWDRVAFDDHSPEETRAVTHEIISKIRKHRTLGEMLEDVPQQVDKILATEKPKNPLSAYNFFIKEKFTIYKNKHAGLSTVEVFKLLSKEFSSLSERKKQKYETLAAKAKEEHKLQMEQYYKDHPEAAQQKKSTSQKTTKQRKATAEKPKTITPFALFKLDKKAENAQTTTRELRNQWSELDLKRKLKYIQQAFRTQSENTANALKLTKGEQQLLEQAKGKPGSFPRSTSEYYLKHYAENDTTLTLTAWRKQKMVEYKNLSKLRKLELEIEYRQAKQEYVNKYEAYIEGLADEQARQAEIELLRSFIATKMDKHDRVQCDNRPLMSMMEVSRVENEMVDLPIAESTTLAPKRGKAKDKALANSIKPKPEPAAVASPLKSQPLKSILKSPMTAVPKAAVAQEFVVPGTTTSSPNKKRKHSLSGHDSDSSSTAEKRSKLSIVTLLNNEETGKTKSDGKANGTKPLPDEPVRPPTNTLEFYREKYFLGKPETCEASFKKLSAARRASIKREMSVAHRKYFKQLQKFLKSVPQKNIELYLQKLKQAERACNRGAESSSEDEDDGHVSSLAKGTPKQEPQTSSCSSEDEDDAAAASAKPQNGANNREEDDESSSDE